jgi:hypothetical protein
MNSTKHRASLLVSVIAFVAGDASAQTMNLKAAEARDRQGSLYLWLPVVENYRVMYFYQLEKNNPAYKGSFNSLANVARVFTHEDRAIQRLNSDTPYSFLWLDLRAEPQVLSIPDIELGRYYVWQTVDAYINILPYFGTRTRLVKKFKRPIFTELTAPIVSPLSCIPPRYAPYAPSLRGHDWGGMTHGLEATAGVHQGIR